MQPKPRSRFPTPSVLKPSLAVAEQGRSDYLGQQWANATYFLSHGVDTSSSVTYGINRIPLVRDEKMDISRYIHELIDRFDAEGASGIAKLG